MVPPKKRREIVASKKKGTDADGPDNTTFSYTLGATAYVPGFTTTALGDTSDITVTATPDVCIEALLDDSGLRVSQDSYTMRLPLGLTPIMLEYIQNTGLLHLFETCIITLSSVDINGMCVAVHCQSIPICIG
jgi:hypothetical protein